MTIRVRIPSVRRRGLGDVAVTPTGSEPTDSFLTRTLASLDGLADLAAKASSARGAPADMAKIANEAEAERDAERAASRKWAQGAASSVGAIGAYIATTGVGAVVGGAIIAAAAIAYGIYEGVLALADYFEHDYDSEEQQDRVKREIAWYLDKALPFPEWNQGRHGHLEFYGDELARSRESLEAMPPEHYRAAIFRASDRFRQGLNDNDPIVLATLLVGGEGGRSWTYVRSLSDELTTKIDPGHYATNKQAADLLVAAVGTTCAQALNLPSTHWHACIEAARKGWAEGIAEAIGSSYEHTGSVGIATATIRAEEQAAALRAELDAAEAAAPGTLGGIFGIRYATLATVSGSRFDLLSREAPSAKVRRPEDVPGSVAAQVAPPRPEVVPVTPAQAVVGGTLLAAGGWWLLKSAAAAGVRRILGL